MYIYIYTYIYIYIQIHTHTHIYIYICAYLVDPSTVHVSLNPTDAPTEGSYLLRSHEWSIMALTLRVE